MNVYIDASAAVKLFADEAETSLLRTYVDDLATRSVALVSSVLLETELRGTAVRDRLDQSLVSHVIAAIDLLELPRRVFAAAGFLPVPGLRSLDAVHLAAALESECDLLVTYDIRMRAAAEVVGLQTVAPR